MKTEQDLIDAFADVEKLCEDQIDWLDKTALSLLNCFAMIQKHVITSKELLYYYWRIWLQYQPQVRQLDSLSDEELAKFKHDYTERLLIVARSTVIFSLSIVEFMFKTIVKETTDGPLHDWYTTVFLPVKKKNQHLYLSTILNESRRLKILTTTEHSSWQGILKLRNILVHNNGISEKTSTLEIGDLRVTMREAAMTKLALLDYPIITKTMINLTRNWLEIFLQSHTLEPDRLDALDLNPE